MKTCASCKGEKPEAEFGVNRSRPSGLHPYCKVCARAKQAEANLRFRTKNPRAAAQWAAEKRKDPAVREARQASERAAYAENPHKRKEYSRNYNRANPEVGKAYRANKPEVVRAIKAKRRAAELNAMPGWADQEAIRSVYAEARRRSVEDGEQYHVDHIVPLRGRSVSGLHVHWNLQILSAFENRSKGNRLLAAA